MNASRFQKFVEFIIDNLFDLITVCVAAYIVTRHQFQPFTSNDIPNLVSWLLGVIGLIAVSGLWERNRRLHRIETTVNRGHDLLLKKLSEKVSANSFFLSERSITNDTFASANTICILGFSLARTSRDYHHIFGQRLAVGGHIRAIVADPENETLMQTASLASLTVTAEDWKQTIQRTISNFRSLIQMSKRPGKIEIGYLPFLPSFGIVMVDPYETHGFCIVDIYHHKSTAANASFYLSVADDPQWFGFFRQQFELLWDTSRKE